MGPHPSFVGFTVPSAAPLGPLSSFLWPLCLCFGTILSPDRNLQGRVSDMGVCCGCWGTTLDFLGSTGVGTISSVGITLSLASEEPESSQEPEGGPQRTELSSEGPVSR